MSQYNDTGFKSFAAAGAIPQFSRVKLGNDGTVDVAGLTDRDIGTAVTAALAAGDVITVKLRSAPGTHKMIAIEALAAGALIYTEASGKVQDTAAATAFILGHALEAATADGDVIECMYGNHGDTAAT